MTKVSKELLKNYVKEQNFKSSNDVLTAMKEMFADVLQEALEAEMDAHLGYDRYEISEKSTDNRRNGYSKRTVKSELGNVELNMPEIERESLSHRLYLSISAILQVLMKKFCHCMQKE